MAFNATFENSLSLLLFNNTNISNYGDATGLRGSSAAGNLCLSLHTADPSAGNQSTSEAAYTSYHRANVSRDSGNLSVSGNITTLVNTTSFPQATGGSETETYAGIGIAYSGAGVLLASAALSQSIVVTTGVTPQLTNATVFKIT